MASALSKSIRLNPTLMAAASREGSINKRTAPKQIEFWAELGKTVELVMDHFDVLAVIQGFKKIKVESVESVAVDPRDVFNSLEESRRSGELAKKVTSSAVYFEASQKMPGLIDRVNSATGERQTGQFYNGEFKIQE
jgi:ParD-like antitoxin of type II bacterial toxin-antitoxin system